MGGVKRYAAIATLTVAMAFVFANQVRLERNQYALVDAMRRQVDLTGEIVDVLVDDQEPVCR